MQQKRMGKLWKEGKNIGKYLFIVTENAAKKSLKY